MPHLRAPAARPSLQAGLHALWLLPELRGLLLAALARLSRLLELVSSLPFDRLRLFAGQPAQHKAEARQLGVAAKVPVGVVLVRRLVIVMRHVVFHLRATPGLIVALEELALVNRKCGNADARQ